MRIQERLAELLAEYRVPSGAIGVVHNGQISEFAVGFKNVETKEPVSTDTVYQCGSMTKTWTAVAFMQLVDEGRIDLDEPVRDYLPGFTRETVTARHLLNHTNGIEELYGDVGEGEDVYELMAENCADAPQVFPVGHTHGYSAALGYAILARILEVRDGKRWDAIMRERLFRPMGLRSTHTWHEDVDPATAVTGHLLRSLDDGPFVTPMDRLPREYGPGGNLTSTTGEVLVLAQLLLNAGVGPNGNRILSADAVHEMMHSRVPVPDPYLFGPEWGLGLIVCDWSGQTVYASDGSTIGQNARLRLLPDSNTAIVMLTNGSPRDSFYRTVFNEILSELGTVTIPGLPTPNPDLRLDPAKYVGVYERLGTRFEVQAEGGALYLTHVLDPLHAQVLGKPERIRYELLPVDETHFLMPPADPLEDTQSAAIYERYLHTNARVHVRLDS